MEENGFILPALEDRGTGCIRIADEYEYITSEYATSCAIRPRRMSTPGGWHNSCDVSDYNQVIDYIQHMFGLVKYTECKDGEFGLRLAGDAPQLDTHWIYVCPTRLNEFSRWSKSGEHAKEQSTLERLFGVFYHGTMQSSGFY